MGWAHGGVRDEERKGSRTGTKMVFMLPQDVGGETDASPAECEAAVQRARGALDIDDEGYVTVGGRRLKTEEQVAKELGTEEVVAQLFARARIYLAAHGVEVVEVMPTKGSKEERAGKTFIHAENTRWMFVRALAFQLRHSVRAVHALDGSRRMIDEKGEETEWRASRAAIRHCGQVRGGRLYDANDSYTTELVALLDAVAHETEETVMVLFDASSPPEALRSWRSNHERRKRDYYNDEELGAVNVQARGSSKRWSSSGSRRTRVSRSTNGWTWRRRRG